MFHNIGPRFIDCTLNNFQVLKASHYGAETTTFTCSVFESCQSYLANNTFDGMIVSTCCNTDYCNDHLGRYLFVAIYCGHFSDPTPLFLSIFLGSNQTSTGSGRFTVCVSIL